MISGTGAEGSSSNLSGRLQTILGRTWFRILIILAIAASSLAWLQPSSWFLYGTDSFHWVNPFSFNFNPLVQYSYLYSTTFPVPDAAALFYTESIVAALFSLGFDAATVERIVVVAWVLISVVGVFRLLQVLNTLTSEGPSTGLLEGSIASVIYVANPFTLTLVWWHFGNYSFFYAYLPLLMSLLVRWTFSRQVQITESSAILALGIVLAPGLTGGYAVAAFYGILALGLSWVGLNIRRLGSVQIVARGLSPFVLTAGILLCWTVVPYAILPTPGYGATNYVTASNLIQSFSHESLTTSMLNVFTLTASPWLPDAPDAFGWQGYIKVVSFAAIVIPILFAAGLLLARKRLPYLLVLALSLPLLFVSVGLNGPWGAINLALVRGGGPLVVIESAFTILSPYYCLGVTVGAALLVVHIKHQIAAGWRSRSHPTRVVSPKGLIATLRRGLRRPTSWLLPTAASCAIAVALVATALPFETSTVYATTGSNIDAFQLPGSALDSLQSYFLDNYSGPFFYAVVLPISSLPDSQELNINGQTFDDSTDLLASYIPYPLIWTNNSILAEEMSNYFASDSLGNLRQVLSELHAKYIVFNRFADMESDTNSLSPNGETYNLSALSAVFNETLGEPVNVGGFSVWADPGVAPIVTVSTGAATLVAPDLSDFLNATSSVSGGDDGWLSGVMWSQVAPGNQQWVETQPISFPVTSTYVGTNESYLVESNNGTLLSISQASAQLGPSFMYNASTDTAEVRAARLTGSENPANVTTDMTSVEGGLLSNVTGVTSLEFNRTFDPTNFYEGTASVQEANGQWWLEFDLVKGSLTIQTLLYGRPGDAGTDFGLTAYYNGIPYAWNDLTVPGSLVDDTILVKGWVNSTAVSGSLNVVGGSVSASESLVYSYMGSSAPSDFRNRSAAPPQPVNLTNYSLREVVTDAQVLTTALSVFQTPPVERVFIGQFEPAPPVQYAVTLSMDASGNIGFRLSNGNPAAAKQVVLAYPPYPLWSLQLEGSTVKPQSGLWPLDVVFLIPNGTSFVSGTLEFRAFIDAGLYVSGLELGSLLTVFGVSLWKRRRGRV